MGKRIGKKTLSSDLNVGDWVTAYRPGIWQIYRILTYVGKDPASDREDLRTAIFCKRFISHAFKRSFSQGCCDPLFVKRLDSSTQAALDEFVRQNQALVARFDAYEPKPIDSIYNASILIPERKSVADIEAVISRKRSFTELEIEPYLLSLGFDTQSFPCWGIQFVSKDHRCENGYLVYKFHRVLPF